MMFAAALAQCLCLANWTAVPQASIDRAFQQAAALVAPSVVRIDTIGGKEQLEPGLVSAGATTGLVISSDGYLVSSAFHFVSQPASIIVTLPDGRRLAARQIATDRQRMITLLKVDAERLTAASAAPRDSFRVGQWAIALGRTFDSETPSISVGIVSALDRVWGKAIQTDAKISPVNYGGPLVDIEGRVLGLLAPLSPHESGDTAGVEWYDSGIGFAVPLVDILSVVEQLKLGADLLPGLLGVTFRGKDLLQGEPVVEHVRFGSPAEISGLKSGDKITAIDGQPVARMAELRHVLGGKYAGDTLQCEVLRGDKTTAVAVVLTGKLQAYTAPFLGILPSRGPVDANAPAVVVQSIWPDGPAANAGVMPKDTIRRVNQVEIASSAVLTETLRKLRPGAMAELEIQRGETIESVQVTLGQPPAEVPAEWTSQPPFGKEERPADLRTGHFTETLAGHDREYWLYVPEAYRPDQPQSLVVFLHPSQSPQEQAALTAWRSECERRGIILLAPQSTGTAGWSPNDLEFLGDCVARVREIYTIAEARVAVVGLGNSAPVAALWAFRDPKLMRGLALIDSVPLGKVPENTPERQLKIYALARGRTLEAAKWSQALGELRTAGYSAILTQSTEPAGQYPALETNSEIARWVDTLDAL